MIYFSHTLGGGGAMGGGISRPTFGLRVQQVQQGGNNGDPEAGDSMHRRQWLNWQMDTREHFQVSNMRLQLGNRLTYDVTNRRFGSPASRSAMQLVALPSMHNDPAAQQPAHPTFAAATHSHLAEMREVAADALTAFAPARFTSAAAAAHMRGAPMQRVAQVAQVAQHTPRATPPR